MRSNIEPRSLTFIEQARRGQILRATAEVVAYEGFGKASLARIAQQAGVSKGVVTYHFSTKREILDEMVRDYYQRGWDFMAHRIYAEDTAVGQVRAWISTQIEFFTSNPSEFFAAASITTSLRDDAARAQSTQDNKESVDGMAEILAAGQEEGQLRDFNPHSVANIILRSIDGVLSSWANAAMNDDTLNVDEEIDALKDFIGHAIRKASP